jgi:hypothetical protein
MLLASFLAYLQELCEGENGAIARKQIWCTWLLVDLKQNYAPGFQNILNLHICVLKNCHIYSVNTYMSWILVKKFVRNCIVFWATRKKQICGYV